MAKPTVSDRLDGELSFTASSGLYAFHPDADADAVYNQLTAKLGQLLGMLMMVHGESSETFRSMNDRLQNDYLWGCFMAAQEAANLTKALAPGVHRG